MCFLSLLVALAPNLGTLWQWWNSPSQPECREGWEWGEEEWRQADPHPDERDSFHYRTSEKERERENQKGTEQGGSTGTDSFCLQHPQSRNLSPWWQITTATASDVQLEAAWVSVAGEVSNISQYTVQPSVITHARTYTPVCFKNYFIVLHTNKTLCCTYTLYHC